VARLTANRDAVVVRLVYDGPPRSGKTTSLGSLAKSLGRSLFSPEEAEGRTLFFDWLEFVGGRFQGLPIRCEIISVPGQESLAARRRALLAEADAVVFVLNGAPDQLPLAVSHLRELRESLDLHDHPRPGIVVQANHRDRPDALAVAELQDALGLDGLALIESVATESQGIREAFVLSVRLALDRVRELAREERLTIEEGEEDVPAALLRSLRDLEEESLLDSLGEVQQAGDAERAPSAPRPVQAGSDTPRLPDSRVPIGRVWPPIEGRIVLHSAPATGEPRRSRDGSWRYQEDGWHFHSMLHHEFAQTDEGKQALLTWAQHQTAGRHRLSPQRCIVLAETGSGTVRLWQVVRGRQTLSQRLRLTLPGAAVAEAAGTLNACTGLLLDARKAFRTEPPLPCHLDVVGDMDGAPIYCGLLPLPDWRPEPAELGLSDDELVRREILMILEAVGGDRHWQQELLARLVLELPAA
jgi:hypothetical protein